jgi:hypothetical protein
MKVMKIKIPNLIGIPSIIKENITKSLTYKIFLTMILLIIITIVVYKFTYYIESLKYEKLNKLKQNKIEQFMEEFLNQKEYNNVVTEGFEDATLNEIDDSWQTDASPFSFNNNCVFKKKYGALNGEDESIIEGFNILNKDDWDNAFDPNKNGIAKGATDFGNSIVKPIQDWINDNVVGPVNKIVEYVNDFGKLINQYVIDPIAGGFQTILDFIGEVKSRFVKLGDSIVGLGKAIGDTFVTIFEAIQTSAVNVGNLIYGGGKCLVHFMQNFRSCFIFWILDAIGELIYSLFVLLPIWFIDALTGFNIKSYLDKFIDIIEYVDSIISKFTKFSLIHYPQSILNDCYLCNGVNFSGMVTTLNNDNNKIRGAFNDLGDGYKKAAADFIDVFS